MATITKIESYRPATFNTITKAVKYLDNKYTRDGWVKDSPNESIRIGYMSVYVQYGLRCDPDNDQFGKFKQWESKYSELNVRLS